MARHSGVPTFVVAASNASPESLDRADYVCDGVADEVQINLAIVAAGAAGGGKVELTEGLFTCAASIVDNGVSDITIEGQGPATILRQANGAEIHVIYLTSVDSWRLYNFKVDGNKANNPENDPTLFHGIWLSSARKM